MKRRISLFIVLLLLFFCTVGIAQPAYLLQRPYAVKYYFVDSLIHKYSNAKPDEFLKHLNDLEKWANTNGDPELAGTIAVTTCRLILNTNGINSSVESKLLEIETRAGKHELLCLQADALQAIGFYYWNKSKKRIPAFEYYLSAYKRYKDISPEVFPPKQEYISALGTSYYVYEDYDNAIKYLRQAIATKPAVKNEHMYSIYNTLGLCYRKLGMYDSSDLYFRKVYEGSDTQWVSIAGGNIGINYFHQHKYAEAIPLLEKDINTSLATNQNLKNAANSICVLATIYYLRNDLDKSEQLLVKALSICAPKSFWPNYELAECIYTQLYKTYAAKNNMRLAYLYADSALTAKDSVNALRNYLSLAKAFERAEFVQHKLDIEQLVNQKKMQELVRNCLFTGIFLLTIIGILFINRQRLKHKKLEAEKRNVEAELNTAARLLDNFRESVQEKNNIIDRITNEMERKKQEEDQQTDTELITQLEQATILTDEQWENFRILFEKVHKGFFVNLKKKIPDLTQAEIRFLALTKLKLSSKDMASMLGVSSNAIRIYRHRLRKKLSLDKDDMIEQLAESI